MPKYNAKQLKDNKLARVTVIREATLKAINLGFRKLIVMVGMKQGNWEDMEQQQQQTPMAIGNYIWQTSSISNAITTST